MLHTHKVLIKADHALVSSITSQLPLGPSNPCTSRTATADHVSLRPLGTPRGEIQRIRGRVTTFDRNFFDVVDGLVTVMPDGGS